MRSPTVPLPEKRARVDETRLELEDAVSVPRMLGESRFLPVDQCRTGVSTRTIASGYGLDVEARFERADEGLDERGRSS